MTTISMTERFNISRGRLGPTAVFLGNIHGADVFGHSGSENCGSFLMFTSPDMFKWILWNGKPDFYMTQFRGQTLRDTGLTEPQLQEIIDFCIARAKLLA